MFHVAPTIMDTFSVKVKNEQQYIDTNRNATEFMLQAAQQVGTVKKFVLTSSIAAVMSGHDLAARTSPRTTGPIRTPKVFWCITKSRH